MIEIARYLPEHKSIWNEVIDQADNAHFMFKRDFMDYHADRFKDCSFVVLDDKQIIGVIPGNIVDSKWYSHQGLSFGGILLRSKYNRILLIDKIFAELFSKVNELNVKEIVYKFIPHIYHQKPCDADIYILSKFDHSKDIVEVSSTINLNNRNKFSQLRIRGKKKADKSGLEYAQSEDWEAYWQILDLRLRDKYEMKPTHSLQEILLLKSRFPDNIKLFTATHSAQGVCAGVVIFETNTVAHCQYIAANDFGLSICALDGLFDYLINLYAEYDKKYFNFGISTEKAGTILNENLIQYKEGFGAQSIIHMTCCINM